MNEKMTDEEVEALGLKHASGQLWHADEQRRALAHIAELTAERDEAKETARICSDTASALISSLRPDGSSLRERVQALEAESARETERGDKWKGRAETAESRLAAIRQRAEPLRRLVVLEAVWPDAEWRTTAADFLADLGDDVRPSAPPEAFTHEKGLDAGVFDESPEETKAARLMREEREAVAEMVRRAAEPTTSKTFVARPAAGLHAFPCCGGSDEHPPHHTQDCSGPAPATSEAFAALKLRRNWWVEHGEGTAAGNEARQDIADLSLLERRMGVQARAAHEVVRTWDEFGASTDATDRAVDYLRAALTDAPAVFTFDDIQRAMSGAALLERDRLAVEAALERLTALRRTP